MERLGIICRYAWRNIITVRGSLKKIIQIMSFTCYNLLSATPPKPLKAFWWNFIRMLSIIYGCAWACPQYLVILEFTMYKRWLKGIIDNIFRLPGISRKYQRELSWRLSVWASIAVKLVLLISLVRAGDYMYGLAWQWSHFCKKKN